ncbi:MULTISPECIES: hypothetical protein [Bacillales]|jgi:hypothetical protein|uniref:Uncharacterized protein n=1 Tax=Brevibacillus aydinogluensis TaxID=927786 RepID=A0AA48RGA9_9BACL|nr:MULTISPECIES: hypothetical protein [Bacillales]MBR8658671.1 hypothetical protein [Brevibacillus sp. NL20B1]MDT3415990.1 hypothetical protein [Brevibacillus aydinogluensis]UFJ61538.1 hypothetical protein IRT44_01385 [Anoxybacillus sediminis]CAJ1001585.1 hypothetical protein BSPP4475_04500 [Brevibacillus aydinogluensis]
MLNKLFGILPPFMTCAGAVLSVLIPWSLHIMFRKLREHGDPPWKCDKRE